MWDKQWEYIMYTRCKKEMINCKMNTVKKIECTIRLLCNEIKKGRFQQIC